jgi:hypothetical protein
MANEYIPIASEEMQRIDEASRIEITKYWAEYKRQLADLQTSWEQSYSEAQSQWYKRRAGRMIYAPRPERRWRR